MCNQKSDHLRVAVLASGNGTNLQAFIDAFQEGELKGEIVLVISDKPDAFALQRAKRAGIPGQYINPRDFSSKEEFESKMVEMLKGVKAELILLAGFMRLLSSVFLKQFPGKVMNVHPSLLPAFPGLRAQKQALEYGVKFTGCTVHFVDEGMDTGPIILQAVVPVLESDSQEELARRIQKEEHRIFVEAVKLYQAGRLKIEGRTVRIID